MGVVLFKRKKKEKIEFIRLYPNPGNGIVNLELKVPESIKELNLKVITPKGKVILSESINYDLKILNLTRLRAGLYLISISKEGYNTVSKKYFRR
ncbi:MAG: T9SS type A sorting domain-containing protein [Flavobacteriales bacterium]|nr:T9SS type A sorting domain-containing protein [Flavobacteriales bacterium]